MAICEIRQKKIDFFRSKIFRSNIFDEIIFCSPIPIPNFPKIPKIILRKLCDELRDTKTADSKFLILDFQNFVYFYVALPLKRPRPQRARGSLPSDEQNPKNKRQTVLVASEIYLFWLLHRNTNLKFYILHSPSCTVAYKHCPHVHLESF